MTRVFAAIRFRASWGSSGAERATVPDTALAVAREHDVIAPAQNREMLLPRRRLGPADEETVEVVRLDPVDRLDVRDLSHRAAPGPRAPRRGPCRRARTGRRGSAPPRRRARGRARARARAPG